MREHMIDHLDPLLSQSELDAMGWVDLPDPTPAADAKQGADAPRSPARPFFLGATTAHTRGVAGPVSLEVLLSDQWVEIGPFVLTAADARQLRTLLHLALELLDGKPAVAAMAAAQHELSGTRRYDTVRQYAVRGRAYLARNATGRTVNPPWEGETLP